MITLLPNRIAFCLALASIAAAGAAQDRPLAPGEDEIRAVVTTASRPPDPAKAPYKDCLSQVKVRVTSPSQKLGLAKDADALLVLWLFQDRTPAPGMELRAGHEISARLLPYSAVEASVGQTMRVDETNDFTSPVFWVNSFKITGGTPQEFAEAPAPVPAPAAADEAAGTGAVDRIMRVLAAHRGQPILDPATSMFFEKYSTVYRKKFWIPSKAPDASGHKLAPLDAIAAFRDQLAERGIELVMVFPPVMASVYPELATKVAWDPARDGRPDRNFMEFAAAVRALGIEVVDVFPELCANRMRADPGGGIELIYYPGDGHWTPHGARLVALKVADVVRSQPWFAACIANSQTPPFSYEIEEEVSDSRLNLGIRSPSSPRPTRQILKRVSRIVPAPGSPPLAALNSPDGAIHVIGDSFAQTGYDQDSSFCDHLAAATGVPVGRSLIAAGATGASLHQFARSARLDRIRSVVWEVSLGMLGERDQGWSRVSLGDRKAVAFCESLDRAEVEGPALRVIPHAVLAGSPLRALGIDFPGAAPSSAPAGTMTSKIRWRAVKLGASPVLVLSQGVTFESSEGERRLGQVQFEISVGGKSLSLARRALPTWLGVEVDLSAFAGKEVDIEFAAALLSPESRATAYWGEPEILDAMFQTGELAE